MPGPAGRPRAAGPPKLPGWRGIIAGFGRGAPGTPPGRAARKSVGHSPGRSVRAAGAAGGTSPGAGRRVRCMPWVDENGLLPGRGPVGRGVRDAGDGGLGAWLVVPPTSAAGADTPGWPFVGGAVGGAVGATGAGAVTLGVGVGLATVTGGPEGLAAPFVAPEPSLGAAPSPVPVAAGATALPLPAEAAAGAALAAFLAAFASAAAFHASPRCSVSRRTTGGSTVEEGDLTYSPMSLSAASTSLLGTPNSLASSWTRTFATVLLLGGPSRLACGPLVDVHAHRESFIERS